MILANAGKERQRQDDVDAKVVSKKHVVRLVTGALWLGHLVPGRAFTAGAEAQAQHHDHHRRPYDLRGLRALRQPPGANAQHGQEFAQNAFANVRDSDTIAPYQAWEPDDGQ